MNTYLQVCASLLLLIALDVPPLSAQERTAPRIATTTGPCSVKAEYKQFDFWLREWDVTDKEKKIATSSIQKIVGGCIVFVELRAARSRGFFRLLPKPEPSAH